jgi:hypothetical protein
MPRRRTKMSTRASIAIMTEEGGKPYYMGTYLHYDGDTAGEILKAHYNTTDKVSDLIEGGSLRALEADWEDCEYFADEENVDEDDDPPEFATYQEVLNDCEWDYAYLFVASEGNWYVTDPDGEQTLL